MCFRSQIDGMSTMTEIHQSRLQDLVYLHESERENLLEESEKERKKMDNNQEKTEYYYNTKYTCEKRIENSAKKNSNLRLLILFLVKPYVKEQSR